MTPDFRTLVLMLVITSFVSAIALYLFYRLLSEVPGLKQAAIAGMCQAVASLFLLLRDGIDSVLSIMVTNGAYFLAYAFYYQAARLFCQHTMEWRWPLIIIGCLYPLFTLFLSHEGITERVIINAIGLGILTTMTSWVLWQDKESLPGRRGLAITFAVFTLIFSSRIVSMLLTPIDSMNFLDNKQSSMLFIWGNIMNISVTVGIIVMTSERLREQLKSQLKELVHAHDIARHALSEQKNFLAMLSHEFKTPLGIIKANADAVLTNETPSLFIKDSLGRIQQTSLRLSGLVDACLKDEWISHIIENNESSYKKLNLNQLLIDLCEEYRVGFINQSVAGQLLIQGDPYLVSILFSSLLDNACKYAQHHERVEVRLSKGSDTIQVSVFDDGSGINKEQQERIFDKYYQIRTKGHHTGSGLGLFFVKRIAEQHKASIQIDCQQGTTFTITFPALDDH